MNFQADTNQLPTLFSVTRDDGSTIFLALRRLLGLAHTVQLNGNGDPHTSRQKRDRFNRQRSVVLAGRETNEGLGNEYNICCGGMKTLSILQNNYKLPGSSSLDIL